MQLSSERPSPPTPSAKDLSAEPLSNKLSQKTKASSATTKAPSAMRLQILLEAKRLFRDRGYAAVSINDIIDGVGVTKPTLYHYFKDKEALYTEVILAAMASGAGYFQEVLSPQHTARENLTALAAGYFEHSPTCMATLLRDADKQLSPDNNAKTQAAYEHYLLQPIEALFLEGLKQGELYPKGALATGRLEQQATTLALLFLTYLDTFTVLHRHHYDQHGVDVMATAQQLVALLWDGVGA